MRNLRTLAHCTVGTVGHIQPKPLKVAPNGVIDKLAWTPVRNRRILFARSASEPILFYCLGGKREMRPDGKMEDDIEALLRETLQEGNVLLVYNTIKHVHTFEGPCHGYVEGTVLKMACYAGDYDGELQASSEVAELAWFSSADMHRTTAMGQNILRHFKEHNLID